MIDLFEDLEEGVVIGLEEFYAISLLKHDIAGAALKTLLEGRARKAAEHLVMIDPNNAGAVAQLQARVSEDSYVLDLLKLDEEVILAQMEEAKAAEEDS